MSTDLAGQVIESVRDLPADFAVGKLGEMAYPDGVLVCPPDAFDVVDVKNPFMEGQAGRVDRTLARRQWEGLVDAFRAADLHVERVTPTPGCEDMVFTANQTLTGVDAEGRPLCLLSHMRHESRRREVPAFDAWFRARGWRVEDPVPADEVFEGGGDGIWHPGRRLLWLGCGPRSSAGAAQAAARAFGVPVVHLALPDPRFYHLDTCLCAVDEKTALLYPRAFDAAGRALLARAFERLIEADETDAAGAMACNAAAFHGRDVVIERTAERTASKLAALGYRVRTVDTGEFMKSGGSVFCMKQTLFA